MPGTGPDRLTRSDLVVVAVFVLVLVAALVALPLHGAVHVLASIGLAIVAAVLTGLVAFRGMRG